MYDMCQAGGSKRGHHHSGGMQQGRETAGSSIHLNLPFERPIAVAPGNAVACCSAIMHDQGMEWPPTMMTGLQLVQFNGALDQVPVPM